MSNGKEWVPPQAVQGEIGESEGPAFEPVPVEKLVWSLLMLVEWLKHYSQIEHLEKGTPGLSDEEREALRKMRLGVGSDIRNVGRVVNILMKDVESE